MWKTGMNVLRRDEFRIPGHASDRIYRNRTEMIVFRGEHHSRIDCHGRGVDLQPIRWYQPCQDVMALGEFFANPKPRRTSRPSIRELTRMRRKLSSRLRRNGN
jgi:hypothetical protein